MRGVRRPAPPDHEDLDAARAEDWETRQVYDRFARVAGLAGGPGQGIDPDHDVPQPAPDPSRALAAFDPGRRGVRALAVVAVLVAAVAGFLAWRTRPSPQPVPVRAGTGAPTSAASASPSTIVVAVTGTVRQPGLVRLPAGSRVADAVEAAGGVLPGTDLGYLNLARKLTDGELVPVGIAPQGTGGEAPAGGGPVPDSKVDLNTAGTTELQSLPGIGPVLAQRIIDYRTRNGGFRSLDDLRKVDGIGTARFDQLKDLVTV